MRTSVSLALPFLFLGLAACTGTESVVTDDSAGTDAGSQAAQEEPAETPSVDEHAGESADEDVSEGPDESANGDWTVGDTIPSGMEGVADITILAVHKNGSGDVCGTGKTATLKYKAMLADGKVIDPGTRPFSFEVGSGRAIKGWDVIVSKMRIGDSFTATCPQQLAYGASKGDLKFDMELLTVQ
ncbi:MAG: FKBP-type peptidyl-prolyl cis-trans isomerase [Planctomycetota bacterium]|jgi:FKBP-type peptidyl-prolyl cis-trans isomerase